MFFKFCKSSKPPEDLRHRSLLIKQRTLLYSRGTGGVLTPEHQHQAAKTCQALFFKLTRHPLCSEAWHPQSHATQIGLNLQVLFFRCFVNGDRLYLSGFEDSSFLLLVTHWEFGSICASLTQFSPRPRPTAQCLEHMCSCRGISDPHHAGSRKTRCRHDTGPDSSLPSSQSICQEQGWPSGPNHWSYSALKTEWFDVFAFVVVWAWMVILLLNLDLWIISEC